MKVDTPIQRPLDRQDEFKAPKGGIRLLDIPPHAFVMIDGSGRLCFGGLQGADAGPLRNRGRPAVRAEGARGEREGRAARGTVVDQRRGHGPWRRSSAMRGEAGAGR